jgi:hypothetical protein
VEGTPSPQAASAVITTPTSKANPDSDGDAYTGSSDKSLKRRDQGQAPAPAAVAAVAAVPPAPAPAPAAAPQAAPAEAEAAPPAVAAAAAAATAAAAAAAAAAAVAAAAAPAAAAFKEGPAFSSPYPWITSKQQEDALFAAAPTCYCSTAGCKVRWADYDIDQELLDEDAPPAGQHRLLTVCDKTVDCALQVRLPLHPCPGLCLLPFSHRAPTAMPVRALLCTHNLNPAFQCSAGAGSFPSTYAAVWHRLGTIP